MTKINCDFVSLSICLSDLQPEKIINYKNGKKYVNLQIGMRKEKDNYGNDLSITYQQSKEERLSKDKKVYLSGSNARQIIFTTEQHTQEIPKGSNISNDGDLPF